MVINRRFRAIALPLLLYSLSGATGAYFVWHAAHGGRGLEVKAQYKRQMKDLTGELASLQAEKAVWSRRVELMRGGTIDRDILDEEARFVLGRLNRDDLVVLLPPAGDRP